MSLYWNAMSISGGNFFRHMWKKTHDIQKLQWLKENSKILKTETVSALQRSGNQNCFRNSGY